MQIIALLFALVVSNAILVQGKEKSDVDVQSNYDLARGIASASCLSDAQSKL